MYLGAYHTSSIEGHLRELENRYWSELEMYLKSQTYIITLSHLGWLDNDAISHRYCGRDLLDCDEKRMIKRL